MENLNNQTAAEALDTTTTMTDANGNPTEAQVADWKQRFNKVKCFEVDGLMVYFKQPTRQLVSAANTALAKTRDVTAYQETILKNTQLNFIQETADDVELYFALAANVDAIVTSKVATLKN
ncbi:MAG: hypothetical protein V4621_08150 [Pseudomonadota bacterium]